jgi:hypothetical protein
VIVIVIFWKNRVQEIFCDRYRVHFLEEFELEGPKTRLVAEIRFYPNAFRVLAVFSSVLSITCFLSIKLVY